MCRLTNNLSVEKTETMIPNPTPNYGYKIMPVKIIEVQFY
jgi:hypothetical protein